MKKTIFTAAVLCAALQTAYAQRIVVMSPDVTDIVVALGGTNEIVGRDQTAQNPEVKNKPVIGIYRQLNVEPIIAAKPDLAIGSWMVQPASIFDRLKGAGVNAVNVAPKDDLASYSQAIRTVGRLMNKTEQANALAGKWQAQMKQQLKNGKRYLFSYDGRLVAGKNTAADEIIRSAGGINAASNLDGMKPLTREAWIAAKPDVIIIADHNMKLVGSAKQFAARPEIAGSNAAKNGKIYFWKANDMFRYGLDTPEIVRKLNALAK